jgi:hypothetical protein
MKDADSLAAGRSAATRWLMLTILAWGLLLALGTYLFGGNQPLLRAAIVAGCTICFLGIWLTALAVRRGRSNGNV